jgi:plastocyanin domain-containing protein
MRIVAALLALAFSSACSKDKDTSKPSGEAPSSEARVANTKDAKTGTDGIRRIEIEAGKDGYVPGRIVGKPGEKLKLLFTRVASGGECMAQLKTPDGKLVELPLNKQFAVDVTVPSDGEVKFACGMDMFFGVIVADKA